MPDLPAINIASREFKANPHPFYARLRAEAPVYRTVLPDRRATVCAARRRSASDNPGSAGSKIAS